MYTGRSMELRLQASKYRSVAIAVFFTADITRSMASSTLAESLFALTTGCAAAMYAHFDSIVRERAFPPLSLAALVLIWPIGLLWYLISAEGRIRGLKKYAATWGVILALGFIRAALRGAI